MYCMRLCEGRSGYMDMDLMPFVSGPRFAVDIEANRCAFVLFLFRACEQGPVLNSTYVSAHAVLLLAH